MAKRPSLKDNLTKPDVAKAQDAARKIAGKPAQQLPPSDETEYETVSYNLPVDLIDLCRDLADLRHVQDQAAKRELRRSIKAAKRAGMSPPAEPPQQARRSASAVIREALEAHRDVIEAEIDRLRDS